MTTALVFFRRCFHLSLFFLASIQVWVPVVIESSSHLIFSFLSCLFWYTLFVKFFYVILFALILATCPVPCSLLNLMSLNLSCKYQKVFYCRPTCFAIDVNGSEQPPRNFPIEVVYLSITLCKSPCSSPWSSDGLCGTVEARDPNSTFAAFPTDVSPGFLSDRRMVD